MTSQSSAHFCMDKTVADPGFGGRGGGVNCHKQGRSPCSRHEVASGGGSGRGVSPLPILKKM